MKYLILLIIGVNFCFGQINISENFTDSNFTSFPEWVGDTNGFIINSNLELQLNAGSNSSPQQIFTLCQALDSGIWQFRCHIDFNPSSQNYFNVILNTDSTFSNQNLIKIEFGKSSDKIRIFSIENGISNLMSESSSSVLIDNSNSIWGKLTHINSTWTFEFSIDSVNWNQIPSFNFNSNPLNAFGFECNFTTTRKDKFFFDDISIYGYSFRDTIPPKLINVELQDSFRCILDFNEPINTTEIKISDFDIIDHPGTLKSFEIINDKRLQLNFISLNFNSNYQLSIQNIEDLFTNSIQDSIVHISWPIIQLYDIQFSELMIDPSPPIYLPEVEYIELINTSSRPINLYQCHLHINDKTYDLPQYIIPTDSVLVVYSLSSKPLVDSTYNSLFLNSNFSLPNTEANLSFSDSNSRIIHHIQYSEDWYQNKNKSDGGWSLENLNFEFPCLQRINWKASINNLGGSPGNLNSHSVNITPNSFTTSAFCKTDSTLQLKFPFSILEDHFIDKSNFNSSKQIDSIIQLDPFTLHLIFKQKLSPSELYYLEIKDSILPCFETEWFEIPFGLTKKPELNTIALSEIKFNTNSDYTEYLEFKILNQHHINLYDLALSIQIDSIEKIITLSENNYFIEGNSYFVLAKNLELLESNYSHNPHAVYIELKNWQNLPDNWSSIKLLSRNHDLLDSNCYNESWHSIFLSETENVALEKLNLNISGCLKENWASASGSSNFGTPGFENSQATNESTESEVFMTHFSPNNDGIDDFWNYTLNFNASENVIDVYILDLNGNIRTTLAKRASVGIQHIIKWDGRDDNQESLTFGTYIIVINKIESNSETNLVKRAISIVEE